MITLNGTNLRTLGFVADGTPGWLDDPAQRLHTTALPGRPGALAVAPPDEQERRLTLQGVVVGATAQACRDNLDRLSALLHAPSLVIAFSDLPGVTLTVIVTAFTVQRVAAARAARKLPVEIALLALDPYFYDSTAQHIAFGGAGVAMPQGTAPVRPLITLTATSALTNPLLRVLDSGGQLVQSLGLTIALAAGDVLVVDNDAGTARRNGVNVTGAITSGDFLVLDVARQGTFALGQWPRLSVQFATGTTYTCFADYAKAWR